MNYYFHRKGKNTMNLNLDWHKQLWWFIGRFLKHLILERNLCAAEESLAWMKIHICYEGKRIK